MHLTRSCGRGLGRIGALAAEELKAFKHSRLRVELQQETWHRCATAMSLMQALRNATKVLLLARFAEGLLLPSPLSVTTVLWQQREEKLRKGGLQHNQRMATNKAKPLFTHSYSCQLDIWPSLKALKPSARSTQA
eukprot:scaffold92350_cov15-Tisochrysis_lutea.AAC.1